jgi:hypothetical protein
MCRALHAALIVMAAVMLIAASCAAELAPPTVNMLHAPQTPADPPLQADDSAIRSLAPDGWVVTDILPCQLDDQRPREVAVIMSDMQLDSAAPKTTWWQMYRGPSKVLIISENDVTAAPLAEFEFPGSAPPADRMQNIPAPFFTDDLNADGLPELFVRTRQQRGGNMWVFTNMIKWQNGRPIHGGRFGGESPGGLYFLDIRGSTPGRDVILLHPIWPEAGPHQGPHLYQAIIFGWANGYYVRIQDFTSTTMYEKPDPAFTNMRKYLWNR